MVDRQTIDAKILSRMFLAGAKNLEAKKEWINELNVFPVPDGDTGTNMTMTIMSAASEVSSLTDPDMETLAKAISSGSLRGARGNSGVILSQLLRGFTKGTKGHKEMDAVVIATAEHLDSGVMALMIVKEIGVPYVLAKADGTLKGEILKRVGADEIVYPEEEMGARIANNLLGGSMTDLFDLSADTSIVKVPARKEWINKSLVDINFRGKYNVNVIAIEGEGGVDGAPDPTKPIKDEENLVLIGKKEDLVKLRK